MSFDFKERDVSFSEFPIGKFNSVRYPSRDSIFRNILIGLNIFYYIIQVQQSNKFDIQTI